MSTIADKLQELINSKADMKSAIAEKGVNVEGGLTTYAAAIRKIQQGSGGGGTDIDWSGVRFGGSTKIPLAPNELYKCGNMDHMFMGAKIQNIETNGFRFNDIDTSFANSMEYCFASCVLTDNTDLSNWNISNVTTMDYIFKGCNNINIAHLNNWDTSRVKRMYNCFDAEADTLGGGHFLGLIDTIPSWDYSSVDDMAYFVRLQGRLKSLPRMNLSSLGKRTYPSGSAKGTTWILESISEYNFSPQDNGTVGIISGYKLEQTIYHLLTDIGGFIGLRCPFPRVFLNCCPNVTVESLNNIIRDLYDWTTNPDNEDPLFWDPDSEFYLNFGTTNLNKLTDEQKAVAVAKGWTLI